MTAGLDLSINSTGVATDDGRFYIIPSKMTKKMIEYSKQDNPAFTYIPYDKSDDLDTNIKNIGMNIYIILNYLKPDKVIIEAPAFSASGRVVDLSVLNGYIRCICDWIGIEHIEVPPTTVKKQYTGNGQADKDLMTSTFKRLYPQFDQINLKIDDIADAHALSVYDDKK